MNLLILSFWHWWVLAVLLAVVEILVPGVYLLWFGVAAALTGFAALAVTMGWQAQALVFAVLSVASLVAGRRLYGRVRPTDEPSLNRRGEQHIGQVFTLETAIVNGAGRARVGDSSWKVSGADLPAGTRVRVVGADGTVLRVEREG